MIQFYSLVFDLMSLRGKHKQGGNRIKGKGDLFAKETLLSTGLEDFMKVLRHLIIVEKSSSSNSDFSNT